MSNCNNEKPKVVTVGMFVLGMITLLLTGGGFVAATAIVIGDKAERATVEQKANKSDVKELREMVYQIKEDVAVIKREVLRNE